MSPELCEQVKALGYKRPTKIQSESIPAALEGINPYSFKLIY